MRTRKIFILASCLFALIFSAIAKPVFADWSSDDTFYNGNNILFYDPGFQGLCSSNTSGGNLTSDKGNIATAYNFFVSKGLSSLAAAAIVGNFQQESGVRPNIQNSIGAYGIAQWLGDRKVALQKLPNYSTLTTQLNFVWSELPNTFSPESQSELSLLKNPPTTDPSKLAIRFGGGPQGYNGGYEGYGKTEIGNRGTYAAQIYKLYSNGGTTTGLGTGCDNTGAANFVYYSQTDPKWAKDPYGSGTIGVDGCAPTSLAMIVATLFDKTVTPKTIADIGAANGSYDPKSGTLHTKLLDPVSQKYGFTYKDISSEDFSVAVDYVKYGGLIYLAGAGPAPFTSGGHVVVMRGITSDGRIIIADPYRGQSDIYSVNDVAAYRGTTIEISK